MNVDIYQENGYKNREHYLMSIAEEYGIPLKDVKFIASLLGPDEDFDGLLTTLEDIDQDLTLGNCFRG